MSSSVDATSTSLAEDLQDLQLDRPAKGLKVIPNSRNLQQLSIIASILFEIDQCICNYFNFCSPLKNLKS